MKRIAITLLILLTLKPCIAMTRLLSVNQLLNMKFETINWNGPFSTAFGQPESCGVWLIWGNSGNGKTSFTMQLVKELAHFAPVLYNSLEEGKKLTMQLTLAKLNMADTKHKVYIGSDSMTELDERLSKRKAPRFIVIDSVQYTGMTYPAYVRFKEKHRDKLLIFISHATGKNPSNRTAVGIKYDADLKIWVEGYRAISNGRYNPGGVYTIWEEGSAKYWSAKHNETK